MTWRHRTNSYPIRLSLDQIWLFILCPAGSCRPWQAGDPLHQTPCSVVSCGQVCRRAQLQGSHSGKLRLISSRIMGIDLLTVISLKQHLKLSDTQCDVAISMSGTTAGLDTFRHQKVDYRKPTFVLIKCQPNFGPKWETVIDFCVYL